MDVSSLIGGLGIGSVFTLFLKEYFEHKKILSQRAFEEKRNAYINYLEAVSSSQTMSKPEAVWLRTAAIERIKLCGNAKVLRLLDIVSSTPPDSPRNTVNELIQAMREDLF
ncbi:MAG: hypothetical protein GYA47_09275 [Desulfovibrio sp.]|nr:hypothetical protein [Desulfovibrio sp.]